MVVIKETRQATNQRAKNRGVELFKFEEVERIGAQKNHPEVPPKTTDLCTICYTSGTTGNPKGVMLTHQNVMASISAVLIQLGEHRPSYKDTMISFLPLAHMLERCCENGMYMVGASVGFYSGDIKRLPEDMKALRPTVMPAVPRLLNRMYDKVSTTAYEIYPFPNHLVPVRFQLILLPPDAGKYTLNPLFLVLFAQFATKPAR